MPAGQRAKTTNKLWFEREHYQSKDPHLSYMSSSSDLFHWRTIWEPPMARG